MARKLAFLLGIIILVSLSARAQGVGDRIELSAGYSYMRFHSIPSANLNGFDVSGQYKISDWLGAVVDVGGEYGQVGGVSSRVYTYLVGPQVTLPRPWKFFTPFAHVMIGGSHFDGGGFASKGFAYDIGAGVDAKIKPRLSWRIIAIDEIPTHLGGNTQHNARVSTGIVFRF